MKVFKVTISGYECSFEEPTVRTLGYLQELDFCETKEELVSHIERDKAMYPDEYNTEVLKQLDELLQKFVKGTSFCYVGSIEQYFVIILLTDVTLFHPSGRVSVELVKKVASIIVTVGDEHMAKIGQQYESVEEKVLTELEFAEHVANLVTTGYGYMYTGEKARLLKYEVVHNEHCIMTSIRPTDTGHILLHNFVHHTHHHDDTNVQYYTNLNYDLLKLAKAGAQVSITNDCPNGSKGYLWQKLENGMWDLLGQYDMEELMFLEQWKRMQGFVLYPGIRKDVADKLNMEVNEDFHVLFDTAIEWMSQDDVAPC